LSDAHTRVSALYAAHRDGIYRFLVAQALSPAAAQDVTQDVFLDLFVALQKGTQMNSERAWLYAVAARAAVDHWRRERPTMWAELDCNPGPGAEPQSPDQSPETQAEHKQRLDRIAAGLSKLSRERRLCLQLRMQGLRYREIAKILRVSTSTAADWLTSAIDSVREEANG
jgi:RNA polymerase sigma-70 factor (ECF subfamily)